MGKEFLEKAEENLKAAQLLLENGLYNAAVNRAYYAAFQAAVFALKKFGFDFERLSHTSVQALFNGELIGRKKLFPASLRSYLFDLQLLRNDADYEEISISKKEATRHLKKANDFVRTVERRIEQ